MSHEDWLKDRIAALAAATGVPPRYLPSVPDERAAMVAEYMAWLATLPTQK